MAEPIVEQVVMVELRGGPANGRVIFVSAGVKALTVPVPQPGGFGQFEYRPTGTFSDEGAQVWV